MKEYIAETGGRYTYSDDILNLQELALSMTSIFDACSNFIISGCEVSGSEISPGYVWIDGKVRFFSGCKEASFPYFIFEKNSIDTLTYANEVNKKGRCNYLCQGGTSLPETKDTLTGQIPGYLEMSATYAPRFIDKFIGKYAVLLDTPYSKQTIKKEIVFAGNVSAEKEIETKTAFSVFNPENGYRLKNIVKADGNASVGAYLNALLINEIVINTDGSFSFIKQNKEVARIGDEGIRYTHARSASSHIGSLLISGSHIINSEDTTDDGAVNINASGAEQGAAKFRNFHVYDGKNASVPIFQVIGKTREVRVNASFSVKNDGQGIDLVNVGFSKANAGLTNRVTWKDSSLDTLGFIGYDTEDTFDFTIKNNLGNILIRPKGNLNVAGELHIKGVDIGSIFVSKTDFTDELKKKVSLVAGKQLSSEDFTSEYKKKLDAISQGNVGNAGDGFVTAQDVTDALAKKLTIASNLNDLTDKKAARQHLDVYSRSESGELYLKVSGNLLELVSLTAEEINGLTSEEITKKKEEKQAVIRGHIQAEKKGAADSRLAKTSNLSDLQDKVQARKNISVYSVQEVDKMLEGKLSTGEGYNGSIFTTEHKTKLEAIKTGNFAGVNEDGKSISQQEGYVLTSAVIKELGKKANLLMDGYNDNQKSSIAANLGLYTKTGADSKFAAIDTLFQDYINHLVKQGKTTQEAQKTLRDKINTPSKEEVVGAYLRKDSKLSDLILANADAKKAACRTLGAAYAEEYQTKLADTGWLQMVNSGTSTDTKALFIRQIGNIVSIQGVINTGKRDGSHQGGTVAVIPNQIPPPKYGVYTMACHWNDETKNNRGVSFKIAGNSRNILLYESGYNNQEVEMNFTYMT